MGGLASWNPWIPDPANRRPKIISPSLHPQQLLKFSIPKSFRAVSFVLNMVVCCFFSVTPVKHLSPDWPFLSLLEVLGLPTAPEIPQHFGLSGSGLESQIYGKESLRGAQVSREAGSGSRSPMGRMMAPLSEESNCVFWGQELLEGGGSYMVTSLEGEGWGFGPHLLYLGGV